MSSPAARVYVVDDDANLRNGTTQWLSQIGYEARSFPSAAALLEEYPRLLPGCIVADAIMPNISGLELQRRLLADGCRWPVIMITGHANQQTLTNAVEGGVLALLEKPVRRSELLAALMKGHLQLLGNLEMIPDPDLLRRLNRLARREREVLDLMLQQKLNKQIAAMLGIEETTVKGYRSALLKKLGVRNMLELVVVAMRLGIYKPPKS